MIVAGFGFRRDATAGSLSDALTRAQAAAGTTALDLIATASDRADAPCLRELAATLGLRVQAIDAARLAAIATPTDSATVRALRGTGSTAEASALASAGARLLHPRVVSADRLATCALAHIEAFS